MNQNDFYSDIKESVIQNFSFLKYYGFAGFVENQLAYECHFETKNDYVIIDIWFEAIYSTPIWITIGGYYIDHLEIENPVFKDCSRQRSNKYDKSISRKLYQSYNDNSKLINELYLQESSEIIKRNLQVLNGDLDILKLNTEKHLLKKEQLKTSERIKNKTYTLEYEVFHCEAFEEFTSLKELKSYVTKQEHIKRYRILDWNMEEIVEI